MWGGKGTPTQPALMSYVPLNFVLTCITFTCKFVPFIYLYFTHMLTKQTPLRQLCGALKCKTNANY